VVLKAGSVVTAKFFSEEEKTLAVERFRENYQGIGSHQFKWYQVREAFSDMRVRLESQVPPPVANTA
jgi:MFS transporter, ACS family, allantoate permease